MFKKILKYILPQAVYEIIRRFYFWVKLPPGYEQGQIQILKTFLEEIRQEVHTQKIRAAIVDTKLNTILYGLPKRENGIVELLQRTLQYDYPGLFEAERVINDLRGNPINLEQRYSTRLKNLASIDIINFSGKAALDIGCGDGNLLKSIVRQFTSLKSVVGIDSVAQDWPSSPEDQPFEISFIQTNPFDYLLNLSAESFDVVTMVSYLETLTPIEQIQLIDLAFRRLKSGGTLYIEIPNLRDPEVISDTYWMDPRHLRPISANLLIQTATRVGNFHAGVFDDQDTYIPWIDYLAAGDNQRTRHPDFVLILHK